MENRPIESLMKTTLENIKGMVDVNTIVGEPINCKDGIVIIPISKVSFGFGSGGSDFNSKDASSKLHFGGGAAAGVTINPVSFIVIKDEMVRLLPVEYDSTYDKAIDSIPQLIEMIRNLAKPKDGKDSKNTCENKTPENSCEAEKSKE